jgi:hypothetical protein
VILSGEPMPNDRRHRNGDPVTLVRRPAGTPTPAPNSVELLAELLDRVTASERAAEARHAEVLARLDRIDKAVAGAVDSADCAGTAVEELQRRVRGWLEQLWAAIDPEDDWDEPSDEGDQPS